MEDEGGEKALCNALLLQKLLTDDYAGSLSEGPATVPVHQELLLQPHQLTHPQLILLRRTVSDETSVWHLRLLAFRQARPATQFSRHDSAAGFADHQKH